jgi:hypothetical protein
VVSRQWKNVNNGELNICNGFCQVFNSGRFEQKLPKTLSTPPTATAYFLLTS